jgi:hypothetical protein
VPGVYHVDKLAEFLTSDRHHKPEMSPDSLELMGKQAAREYMTNGTPPNTTIEKLAKEIGEITTEHIKRVCEIANQTIYLDKHEKNKTAGAASSYPRFPLADASVVVHSLSAASHPVVEVADPSYGMAPKAKTSSATDADLAEMFKTASAEPTFTVESADTDLNATKNALKGMKDHFTHIADQHDAIYKQASAEYYNSVKRYILDGGAFADVMVAARSTSLGDEKLASVLAPVVERLILEKVAGPRRLQEGLRDMDKVAHRILNPEHEFVTLVQAIVDAKETFDKTASDLKLVESDLKAVNDVIKRNLRAQSSS